MVSVPQCTPVSLCKEQSAPCSNSLASSTKTVISACTRASSIVGCRLRWAQTASGRRLADKDGEKAAWQEALQRLGAPAGGCMCRGDQCPCSRLTQRCCRRLADKDGEKAAQQEALQRLEATTQELQAEVAAKESEAKALATEQEAKAGGEVKDLVTLTDKLATQCALSDTCSALLVAARQQKAIERKA